MSLLQKYGVGYCSWLEACLIFRIFSAPIFRGMLSLLFILFSVFSISDDCRYPFEYRASMSPTRPLESQLKLKKVQKYFSTMTRSAKERSKANALNVMYVIYASNTGQKYLYNELSIGHRFLENHNEKPLVAKHSTSPC